MIYRGGLVKGVTLVELIVAAAILSILVASIFAFFISMDKSWQAGQHQLSEQRQARMAISDIANSLRRAQIDDEYQVSISDANKRIDFYVPNFYSDCCPKCGGGSCAAQCEGSGGECHTRGEIKRLSKVTYKLNPDNPSQLLKKEGVNPEKVIANNISAISFTCGCENCIEVNEDCPRIDIGIVTQVRSLYHLNSKITLRNINVTLPDDRLSDEEPDEGEF